MHKSETVFLPFDNLWSMAGIYLHIPFCKKACHYCNFHFSTAVQQMPAMIEAIKTEARLQQSYLTEKVNTIYFGGGTPSLLPGDAISSLLDCLRKTFYVAADAEITLEANPDDIVAGKPGAWKTAGVNRLSIGIQSFFEQDLRWMNRAHDATQAVNAVQYARDAGFSNITIDLIYGTPGLSDENWAANINTAITLGIPHLSCYALTVEPKTALDKMIRTNKTAAVDAEQQARHFALLTSTLANAGFEQYEISNFAKPGFRSRHNSSYWQGAHYLGLGPAAHSFNGSSRQWNISNNSLYIQSIERGTVPFEKEILTPAQQLNEYIMTSLRTVEGLDLHRVAVNWGDSKARYLAEASRKHLTGGYLFQNGDVLQLTASGKFLADGIAADLFSDE